MQDDCIAVALGLPELMILGCCKVLVGVGELIKDERPRRISGGL